MSDNFPESIPERNAREQREREARGMEQLKYVNQQGRRPTPDGEHSWFGFAMVVVCLIGLSGYLWIRGDSIPLMYRIGSTVAAVASFVLFWRDLVKLLLAVIGGMVIVGLISAAAIYFTNARMSTLQLRGPPPNEGVKAWILIDGRNATLWPTDSKELRIKVEPGRHLVVVMNELNGQKKSVFEQQVDLEAAKIFELAVSLKQ